MFSISLPWVENRKKEDLKHQLMYSSGAINFTSEPMVHHLRQQRHRQMRSNPNIIKYIITYTHPSLAEIRSHVAWCVAPRVEKATDTVGHQMLEHHEEYYGFLLFY